VSLGNLQNNTAPATSIDITDSATGTITDNDAAAVTIENVTTAENGDLVYTATLDNAVEDGFEVDVSFADVSATGGAALGAGVDFVNTTQTLTFAGTASETVQFTVAVNDDAVIEANEGLTVSLGNLQNNTAPATSIDITDSATGTITDNDAAAVTIENIIINEGDGTATFTVTLNQNVVGGFDVDYILNDGTATGGGIDYDSTGGTLTFAGTIGEVQTITVPITDDVIADNGETFTVSLSTANPLVDATDTATGTINDDVDVTNLSLSATTPVVEGGNITYTATIDNPAGTAMIVSLSNGQVINIAAGDTTGSVPVVASDDVYVGGDTASITVTSTTGGNFENLLVNPTAAVTAITDDNDVTNLNLTASTAVTEGGNITYTATLDNPADTAMSVSLSNGQLINIAAGSTTGSVIVAASDDVYVGGDSASITVTSTTGGNFENLVVNPAAAVTAINDDADTVSISLAGPNSVNEGATTGIYTVNLTDSNGNSVTTINPVSVVLSYTGTAEDGTDFSGVVNVTVDAGASSGTFDIATLNDAVIEGAESFTVTLGAITGGTEFENLIVDSSKNQQTTQILDTTTPPVVEDELVPDQIFESDDLIEPDETLEEIIQAEKRAVEALGIDAVGSVLDTVERANTDKDFLGDGRTDRPDNTIGDFDIEGVKGFSISFKLAETDAGTELSGNSQFPMRVGIESELDTGLAPEENDQLVIRSLIRERMLYVDVDYMVVSNPDLKTSSYSVTLANGDPLPAWLRLDDRGGLVSGEPPVDIQNIRLRVEVNLSDGTTIIRYVSVDTFTGEITAMRDVESEAIAGTKTFSDQVNGLSGQLNQLKDDLLAALKQ